MAIFLVSFNQNPSETFKRHTRGILRMAKKKFKKYWE